MRVIDISRWQGHIDWPQVRKNIEVAMIKVGGSDDGFYQDGMANRNVIEARSAGMAIGVYFYLGGVYAPSQEVQHIVNVINSLGGLKPGEPLCLDWEERRHIGGKDEVGYLLGIVEGLTQRGFPAPIIYMNLNYVKTQNWQPLVTRNCGLWVAAWGDNDAIPEDHERPVSEEWPFWILWQFSSTTNVPGITGRVDQNELNGDVNTFKKYGSGTAVNVPGTPAPVPVTVPNAASTQDYTVKPGDSLSAIAARYGKSWQELHAINRDKVANPNKIYVGQTLRVWRSFDAPQPAAPGGRRHTVAAGENLTVIARKYGLDGWRALYDLNAAVIGGDPNQIKPGQELRIP